MKISANTVRRLRTERGWSQEQLAAASGLGLRTIQRVEAEGKAARETRVCLAATFAVELAELIESADPAAKTTAAVVPNIRRYKIALGMAAVAVIPVLLHSAGVIANSMLVSGCCMAVIALVFYGGFGAYFTGASQHNSLVKRYTQVGFIAAAIFCGFASLADNKAGVGLAAQVTVLALLMYFGFDYWRARRLANK